MASAFGETLSAAIARTKGRSRGFDYLRIGLSCAVVLWHSFRTSYDHFQMDGWLRPTFGLVLPMFFALSGCGGDKAGHRNAGAVLSVAE